MRDPSSSLREDEVNAEGEKSEMERLLEIIRTTPTPASKWSPFHLEAFNITVQNKTRSEFFGRHWDDAAHNLDLLAQEEVFSESPTPKQGERHSLASQDVRRYRDALLLANVDRDESTMTTLMEQVMRLVGSDSPGLVLVQHRPLELEMSRQPQTVRPNLVLMHTSRLILSFVLVGKSESVNLEAQAIACAIAVSQTNSRLWAARGLKQPRKWTIPFLTVRGERVTFYKMSVRRTVELAVALGKKPEKQTVVERCDCPAAWHETLSASTGMGAGTLIGDEGYARAVFRAMDAFRRLGRELRRGLGPELREQADMEEAVELVQREVDFL